MGDAQADNYYSALISHCLGIANGQDAHYHKECIYI
jgi:hypothetical protein